MSPNYKPDFHDFASAEEDLLRSKLNSIKTSLSHPGEKAESAGIEMRQLIRDLLPSEYGVGTGFIAYHANESIEEKQIVDKGATSYRYTYHADRDSITLSAQLDIVIYDALKSGPIIRLGTCEVFPLEGVYGYIEVRSSIGKRKDKQGKTAMQGIFEKSNALQSLRTRLYWRPLKGTYNRAVAFPFPLRECIPIRSYVFILDGEALGSKKEIHEIIQADFQNYCGSEAFVHGVYVNGKGFYRSIASEESMTKAKCTISLLNGAPLSEFKKALYIDLSRFQRAPDGCTIAVDKYFDQTGDGVVGSTLIEENGRKIIRVG
jgi:hypothetical protein